MKPSRLPKQCLHCKRTLTTYAHGLCCRCANTPGVRELYPRRPPRYRSLGEDGVTNPIPPVPTAALPGSEEKIAVLEARAEAGQALWSPLDARRDDPESQEDMAAFSYWKQLARMTA